MSFVLAVIRFVAVWVVGQGVLIALARKKYYPQQWVADMIGQAMPPDGLDPASLIIAGVVAFVATVAFEWSGIRSLAQARAVGRNSINFLARPFRGYRIRTPWERVATKPMTAPIVKVGIKSAEPVPVPVAPKPTNPLPQSHAPSGQRKNASILLAEYTSTADRENLDRALYEMFDFITRSIDPVRAGSDTVANWQSRFQRDGKEIFMLGLQTAKDREQAAFVALSELIYSKYAYYCDELRDAALEDGRRDIRAKIDEVISTFRALPEGVSFSDLKRLANQDLGRLESGVAQYHEWKIAALQRIKAKRIALSGQGNPSDVPR